MPEFIPQPRPSRLADIIAQFAQQQPLAQGILSAGQSIGAGIGARGENILEDERRTAAAGVAREEAASRAGASRQSGLLELLGKGGSFSGPDGQPIDLASMLPSLGLPAGSKFTPPEKTKNVTITQGMIDNFPGIKKLGAVAGESMSERMFLANTATAKVDKSERGNLAPGFRFTADGSGNQERIPGGIAEEKKLASDEKTKAALASAAAQAQNVVDAANSALKNIGATTTGILGSIASKVPGSQRKALQGNIDTMKSSLAFDRLQTMRDNSKTGGALGQVSDNELRLLSSAVTSLDPDQPAPVLKENIEKVLAQFQGILDKMKAAPEAGAPGGFTPEKEARLAELRAKAAAGKIK